MIYPLPRQSGVLLLKSACVGGGKGVGIFWKKPLPSRHRRDTSPTGGGKLWPSPFHQLAEFYFFPIPYSLFPAPPRPACNKNSTALKFPLLPINHPPQRHLLAPKNPSPRFPQTKPGPTPGFFGPNQGQFGSKPGYFGSIPGFPRPKSRCFGPHFPLPRAPLRPG